MAEELIISISGMRGIIGENLTPSIAAEYASAFGSYLKQNCKSEKGKLCVCLGRDSRPSGQMIAAAVSAGLCSVGIDVVDVGVVTTPGVGIMLRHLNAAGGMVITASHNPIKYNGIKLLLDNGIAPPPEVSDQIKQMYLDQKLDFVDSIDCGHLAYNDDTDKIHIDKVLATIDKESIAAKKFKVVLDSVNGAGGRAGIKLLEALGCDIVKMNIEPTGIFAHTPEPTKENLVTLCEQVKSSGADIGFAQDPDADRLAIVDGNAEYIGEEYTLALSAKHVFGKMGGTAAANLSTSRMIDDIAAAAGAKVLRTPVGEANVAGAMIANDCVIGGEGNGGVIDLRVGPIRDSLVAMALVLQLMADSGNSVAELTGQFPAYYVSKEKFKANKAQAQKLIEAVKQLFPDAKVNTSDGCRFDFDNGWVHLRSSNTEPVMRLIVETQTPQQAQGYITKVKELLNEVL